MQFKKLNVNPVRRNTDDGYVRVLSVALDMSYKKTYRLLAEYALSQYLSMNDCRTLKGFLSYIGYTERQLDKKCNVSKFSECDSKAKVCILRVGKNSATVIKNNVIYDSYNPSNKVVNSYWVID